MPLYQNKYLFIRLRAAQLFITHDPLTAIGLLEPIDCQQTGLFDLSLLDLAS